MANFRLFLQVSWVYLRKYVTKLCFKLSKAKQISILFYLNCSLCYHDNKMVSFFLFFNEMSMRYSYQFWIMTYLILTLINYTQIYSFPCFPLSIHFASGCVEYLTNYNRIIVLFEVFVWSQEMKKHSIYCCLSIFHSHL